MKKYKFWLCRELTRCKYSYQVGFREPTMSLLYGQCWSSSRCIDWHTTEGTILCDLGVECLLMFMGDLRGPRRGEAIQYEVSPSKARIVRTKQLKAKKTK